MACDTCSYAYIGVGKFRLAPYPDINNNTPVGNADALNYQFTLDEKTLADFTNPGGGTCSTVTRITEIPFTLQLRDFCPANISLGNLGELTVVTAGTTIVDEAHTAYHGGAIQLENLADNAAAIVVTNVGGATTYTLGTDYLVTTEGIEILSTGTIADGSGVEITYDTLGTTKVDALRLTAQKWIGIFNGINEANDKRVRIIMHRMQINPFDQRDIILDDFGTLTLTGKLLKKDANALGNHLSDYITEEMQD